MLTVTEQAMIMTKFWFKNQQPLFNRFSWNLEC